MPAFRTKRRVAFTPRQMFDVVADVERYPQFLPLCETLVITTRSDEGEVSDLVARMTVGYKHIRETFTTRVRLDRAQLSISVSYVDGPFSHLVNEWRFLTAANGTEIDFYIDYAFRSMMLGLIVGAAFDKAVRSYTEAFEARARTLYGGPTRSA